MKVSLKKHSINLGAVVLATALATGSASAAEKLSIFHWFEYIPQELLNKFTDETGIEVTMDTFDSNEAMLASLKAGALGTYDVAVPSDYMVKILLDSDMLQPFESSELKNFDNIDGPWKDPSFDPGRKHSVPYQWGTTSFAVNRDVYTGDIHTTDILFDPPEELQGKINVLDSQGELILMAQLHLGIEQCSTDREDVKKLDALLQASKEHWVSFNSDGAKDVLVSGDAAVGQIFNGFATKAREEGANIEYAFPKQGYVAWMDNVVLLKDAPNRASAIAFMDFMLAPENAAAVSNYAQYKAGVTGAESFFEDTIKNSPELNSPQGAPDGTFVQACGQEAQALYDAVWTRLKK